MIDSLAKNIVVISGDEITLTRIKGSYNCIFEIRTGQATIKFMLNLSHLIKLRDAFEDVIKG